MNTNDFLRKFIEMRQSIAPPGPTSKMAHEVATLPKPQQQKKMTKEQKRIQTGLQHIIEEKPGRKVVEEYFQEMCNELTASKMA